MKVIVDTNLLVRIITNDDKNQAKAARDLLKQAELMVLPTATLCELCWVLTRAYGLDNQTLAKVISGLVGAANSAVDTDAVTIGLKVLASGGDFADGAIAATGRQAGGEQFVTFDHQAARLVAKAGMPSQLLD